MSFNEIKVDHHFGIIKRLRNELFALIKKSKSKTLVCVETSYNTVKINFC